MKKTLLLLLLICGTMAINAQTIVDTTPSNRNVIIEVFGGINEMYSPDAHSVCDQISAQYPDRVFDIRIHQGYYASAYKTQWGDSLAAQTGLQGYPAGTINRHLFSGSSNMVRMSRNAWVNDANTIMSMASPVNIAAVAEIDDETRQLSVHIETYYTANSDVAINMLNVALLQNNVIGYQRNTYNYNTDYVTEDGQYRHMHMLRDLLTGQWGIEIPATQGTFIDTTIVYTIPDTIGEVAIENLADLEIVAFIAEGHQEILTGCRATMVTTHPQMSFAVDQVGCSLSFQPWATITNSTYDTVTNFVVNYDGTEYAFNKTILPFDVDTVNLPLYTIVRTGDDVQNCNTTKSASLVGCNGTVINGSTHTVTFADFNIYTVAGPFNALVGIDYYGSEATLQLLNADNCDLIWSEGNWSDLTSPSMNSIQSVSDIPNARYYNITFSPADSGLYVLRALDSYGDGWGFTNNSVVSGIWLSNADGEIISESWGFSNCPAFKKLDFYLYVTNTGDGTYSIEDLNEPVDTVIVTINNVGGGYMYIEGNNMQYGAGTNYYTNATGVATDLVLVMATIDGELYNLAEMGIPSDASTLIQLLVDGVEIPLVAGPQLNIDSTSYEGVVFYMLTIPTDTNHTVTAIYSNGLTYYTVTAYSSDEVWGTVTGGGEYSDGTTVTLSAYPQGGSQFLGWSNGSIVNPVAITVSSDTTVFALIAPATGGIIYDTVTLHDTVTSVDTVTLVDIVTVHDTITFRDTLIFSDTVTLLDTVTMLDTVTFVDTVTFTDTLTLYVHDTLIVGDGDTLVIYRDVHDTIVLYDTIYIYDTVYINDSVGIDDPETVEVKLYASDGQVVVEGAAGHIVRLYDAVGRLIATRRDEFGMLRIDVPATGAYLIQIGTQPARRVVVVK